MKKLLYILIFIGVAGCTKELDLIPKDQISDISFWKNAEDYKLAANYLYNFLPAHNYTDHESDIAYGENPNDVSRGTHLPADNDANWNNAYTQLRHCNIIIEKAAQEVLPEGAEQYVAEARWFRAYIYSNLIQRFGDVPLITTVLDVDSPELFGSRTPRKEVADYIISELDEIATDLPLERENSGENKGRITQGAAYALMARIGLFEGTWVKYHGLGNYYNEYLDAAIFGSLKIIQSEEYETFFYSAKPEESYRYQFILPGNDGPGQIVAKRYYPDIVGHAFGITIANAGNMSPTRNLVDLYLCKDGLPIDKSSLFEGREYMNSEFKNRDPRLTNTVLIPGERIADQIYDFADNTTNTLLDPIPQDYPNIKSQQAGYRCLKFCENYGPHLEWDKLVYFHHIIRYAEVLLTYAEAVYERNGSITDDDLNLSINELRDAVSMPHLTNDFVQNNGLDMLNEIRRERTIELAFEGFRLGDLKRWGLAETVMPQAIKGVKWVGTEFETHFPNIDAGSDIKVDEEGYVIVESSTIRTFDKTKHYLFPIPLRQISLNPNIEQNPNW